MDPIELLRAGQLDAALEESKRQIRASPGSVDLRVGLFSIECLLGQYDKALTRLQTMVSLGSESDLESKPGSNPKMDSQEWALLSNNNRRLIACELTRQAVFSGRQKPQLLGEPPAAVGWCLEAFALDADGKPAEAWALRNKAWDESPSLPGKLNGEACEWLSDADLRLGPVFEACIEGRYYWIPFGHVKTLTTEPPTSITELVWLPARLVLATDAEIEVYLPVRYPGTEATGSAELCLARRTEWQEAPGGGSLGLGQKLFNSNRGSTGILETRTLELA